MVSTHNAVLVEPLQRREGQKRLKNLNFSDLYICADPPVARFRALGRGGTAPLENLPEEYEDDTEMLRRTVCLIDRPEFAVVHDGVRYRAAMVPDVNNTWYVLRRGASRAPGLEELGMDMRLVSALRGIGHQSGLVLVGGRTGEGKTTTATALMRDFLVMYGDLGVAIEDPPELPLSGFHGEGQCFQMEVENEDWETPLKSVLRYRPRYILVGEVRTPGAAQQALRIANSGHLVITTIHSGSIEQSLEALCTLAQQRLGPIANVLLADSLLGCMHQRLGSSLHVSHLFASASLGDPVRALIRDGKFGGLTTIIQQQEARLFGSSA